MRSDGQPNSAAMAAPPAHFAQLADFIRRLERQQPAERQRQLRLNLALPRRRRSRRRFLQGRTQTSMSWLVRSRSGCASRVRDRRAETPCRRRSRTRSPGRPRRSGPSPTPLRSLAISHLVSVGSIRPPAVLARHLHRGSRRRYESDPARCDDRPVSSLGGNWNADSSTAAA